MAGSVLFVSIGRFIQPPRRKTRLIQPPRMKTRHKIDPEGSFGGKKVSVNGGRQSETEESLVASVIRKPFFLQLVCRDSVVWIPVVNTSKKK